jgi:CHAT domain-containing protein
MYSVTQGHEIVILTVSKKYAQVLAFEDPRFIGEIKDIRLKAKNLPPPEPPRRDVGSNRFVMSTLGAQVNVARDNYDKVAMAPKKDLDAAYKTLNNWMTNRYIFQDQASIDGMQDFLYRFQKYLLVPINNRLTGIKNLIIAPDDIFNFIPFEALRSFDKKYMVEKYNFRYIHSASVLLALQQRQYAESRKQLLAMGGAKFESFPGGRRSMSDAEMNLLETEVYENIKTGKSQRKAYEALGRLQWADLKGSAEEVKSISKTIPGSEVFLGTDMTENRIKEMSKAGQLKNYKILHLATHGFVEETIPDLSGLVMTLAKDEQGGEDGFLNTPEIAGLQLNTDLTILSACETARGQLFAGEGVTGITQSLILAGSNAALVSLWTVDDAATMNFMSSFYKEVAKGKPYAQVVNELKKKFIKGDFGKEYTHPRFWAPFIYYGN